MSSTLEAIGHTPLVALDRLRRHRAGAQQHRQIVGLLDGEIAGDLP